MGVQDHKIAATSAGNEGHQVYHCHRCGWPFPKQHPSSKHRRAHKRHCGTIDGYKIISSEDHLPVSDDDHASDDDELHTPSPNIGKKIAESSGRVSQKSTRSEDDVYSDAVMDFSDSGISSQLEERFESSEQKSVEGDLHGSGALGVEEAADRPEQYNDARSEELSKPGYLINGNNHADNVMPINTAAEMVSAGHINILQPEHGLGGGDQGEIIPGHDADIQVQECGSASLSLDSADGKVFDQTIAAGEIQDELCDKFVSEVAPSPSESLQTNSSEGVDGVVHSAEVGTSIKTVDVTPVDETHESIDASVGSKDVSHSTENNLLEESLLGTSLVKPNESTKTLDVDEHFDVACSVSCNDKEGLPKTSLHSVETSEGEKSDMTGGDENQSLEFEYLDSVDANSALGTIGIDNAFPCEDNNASMAKKFVDHCGEYTNSTTLETEHEKGEEAAGGVEAIPDSTIPSEKRTDSPSSCAVKSDAKSLQVVSENNSLEFKDDGFEKTIQGDGADKGTLVLQSVGSAEAALEANEIGDAIEESSLTTSSLERTVSPVTSEPQNNIQVATNVFEVESPDISESVSRLEEDDAVLVSKRPLSDSVLLGESAANDGSSGSGDYKASESIATSEGAVEDHENSVISQEISETLTPSVQEVFPTSKGLKVTSPDAKKTHSSDDLSTSKSADIIFPESSDAPSLKQPAPTPLDVKDFHGTYETVDDKTVTDVGDVTRVEVDAMSAETEADCKPTKQTDDASAIESTSSLISRSDSLEANCGSVVSDTLETNSQKHKFPSEEAHIEKSDTFEPPSFMTLVQSGSEGDHKVTAATEIEIVQNNQQPKSDALQAGWFPSLTNVVNESEGRKKNEEVIAKVTNWTPVPVKQQHGPLKSLLNEVKSPNTKQLPTAKQKIEAEAEAEAKHGNMGSVVASETHATKDQGSNKHVEEWNSPARYPIEIKKEKKKGRPFWVSFVCCSSAHRDL